MTFGLRTWDASGALTIDVSDRLTSYEQSLAITAPATGWATTFYSVPGINPSTHFAYTDTNSATITVVDDGINVMRVPAAVPVLSGTAYIFRY